MVWVYLLIIGCVQARSAEVCFGHFSEMILSVASAEALVTSQLRILFANIVLGYKEIG